MLTTLLPLSTTAERAVRAVTALSSSKCSGDSIACVSAEAESLLLVMLLAPADSPPQVDATRELLAAPTLSNMPLLPAWSVSVLS